MKSKLLAKKTLISIFLASLMMFSFTSCSSDDKDTAFLDQISEAEAYSEAEESSEEVSEEATKEGYTAKPVITHMFNIEPHKVVVAGTCEDNSVIKISNLSTNKVVETVSNNGYFIMEIALDGNAEHHYEMTATAEGKKESTKNSFSAKFNAVAEKPADGSAVTIGNNSSLFYDNLIAQYQGTNLLTNTQLDAFKASISKNITKKDINYVYVMVPDVLTVYEERIPEGINKESYNTKFQQIGNALSSIDGVDVIDLTQAFIDNKNGDYPLYYNTSGNLSDYGSYLTYQAIMNYISENNSSEPSPEPSSEATESTEVSEDATIEVPEVVEMKYLFNKVSGKGGDLISSLGIDNESFNENYYYAQKDFESTFPADAECTCPLSELVIYSDKETNTYYTDVEDDTVFGANEAYAFKTNRENLPSAVFLRDDTANAMIPMLAESFNNAYIGNQFDFALGSAGFVDAISSYSSSTQDYVDYVFVIISEENIDRLAN